MGFNSYSLLYWFDLFGGYNRHAELSPPAGATHGALPAPGVTDQHLGPWSGT